MDPQHRLLLETGWSALEDAGLRPEELRDSDTGVFVGAAPGEYAVRGHLRELDAYAVTGSVGSFNAGRLSYHLGLQGPALTVDTACSSSLVALHLACESLRRGECRVALAAGVQVLASPEAFVLMSRTRAVSADGRSKTFDERADGFGRGEGCGVVVLRRLADAADLDLHGLCLQSKGVKAADSGNFGVEVIGLAGELHRAVARVLQAFGERHASRCGRRER